MRIIKSKDVQTQLDGSYEIIKIGDKITFERSEYENNEQNLPITDNEFREHYENFKSSRSTYVDFEESSFLSNGIGGSLIITKVIKTIRIRTFL